MAVMLGFRASNLGGGPLPDMFDRIKAPGDLTVYPNVKMGGMDAYLDHMKAHEPDALANLPVIRDELFLECHHKTYTVQARVKEANRRAGRELLCAEAIQVAACSGEARDLKEPWEKTLFNQFHDILPGTSFPMVYQDVFDDYERADAAMTSVRDEILLGLMDRTDGGFSVFNQLPWRRDAAVVLRHEAAAAAGAVNFLEDDLGEAPRELRPHQVVSPRIQQT